MSIKEPDVKTEEANIQGSFSWKWKDQLERRVTTALARYNENVVLQIGSDSWNNVRVGKE